jgi:hypothetical protein
MQHSGAPDSRSAPPLAQLTLAASRSAAVSARVDQTAGVGALRLRHAQLYRGIPRTRDAIKPGLSHKAGRTPAPRQLRNQRPWPAEDHPDGPAFPRQQGSDNLRLASLRAPLRRHCASLGSGADGPASRGFRYSDVGSGLAAGVSAVTCAQPAQGREGRARPRGARAGTKAGLRHQGHSTTPGRGPGCLWWKIRSLWWKISAR